MSESKIRMFVINDSEDVTVKSCAVNISKDSNFDFATIDNSRGVAFENITMNVLDPEVLEKLIITVSDIKDSSINPQTGNSYQADILRLLESIGEKKDRSGIYNVIKECTTLASGWASVYPVVKDIFAIVSKFGS